MKKIIFVMILVLLSSIAVAQIENIDWEEKTANSVPIPTAGVDGGFVKVDVKETTGNSVDGLFEVYTQEGDLIFSDQQRIGAFEEYTFTYPTDLMEPGVFYVFVINKDMFVGYEIPLAEPIEGFKTGEPISMGDDGVLDPSDIPKDLPEKVYYPIDGSDFGIIKTNGIHKIVIQDEEGRLLILTPEDVEGILVVDWDAWEKENVQKKSFWERFVDWLKGLFGASDTTLSENVMVGGEGDDKLVSGKVCDCMGVVWGRVKCEFKDEFLKKVKEEGERHVPERQLFSEYGITQVNLVFDRDSSDGTTTTSSAVQMEKEGKNPFIIALEVNSIKKKCPGPACGDEDDEKCEVSCAGLVDPTTDLNNKMTSLKQNCKNPSEAETSVTYGPNYDLSTCVEVCPAAGDSDEPEVETAPETTPTLTTPQETSGTATPKKEGFCWCEAFIKFDMFCFFKEGLGERDIYNLPNRLDFLISYDDGKHSLLCATLPYPLTEQTNEPCASDHECLNFCYNRAEEARKNSKEQCENLAKDFCESPLRTADISTIDYKCKK